MKKRYLLLADGTVFAGAAFGADAEGGVIGECVFTTGMTGYLETLTDPSYAGQIVVQTFPMIGNYGVIEEDFESGGLHPLAYIVREHCVSPSNFRADGTLDALLKARNIPGISGIDTRELTKIIRERGVMNAAVCDSPEGVDLSAVDAYAVKNAVAAVSVKKPEFFRVDNAKHTVCVIDYGAKRNIIRELNARGCDVILLPHDADAKTVASFNPDGVQLTNGPGDPAENAAAIENLREIVKLGLPVFGICLGHQLLALAHGGKTYKLKYGHRGANQPVKNLHTGKLYVTSQNHGYAVDAASIPENIGKPLFVNVNDGTNEGFAYGHRVFSSQFHPEACGGPKDTAFMFGRFVGLLKGVIENA